ncbi:SH3 domain-containing protein [Texcoconibacillus texcoconensis]|uniref:SH3b domain-containing protein n=1 Tax=Texcoconibacillus texcoconensis TaxID=1095777 RepID=A0A840QU33_9BACI|nr:SH3 domain-containing protein [Texcoconibacillus texcoconensis]MBB5175032.1 hypothetical protein [Texcoconibacillus texcoconensis]
MWKTTNVIHEKQKDTNPDLYVKRAEQCLASGSFEQALKECDEAIRYSGGKSHYLFEKVKVLHSINRHSQCRQMIEAYISQFHRDFYEAKLAEVYQLWNGSLCGMKVALQLDSGVRFPEGTVYMNKVRQRSGLNMGVVCFRNGDIYAGEVFDDVPHGYGTLFSEQQVDWKGRWKNGRKKRFHKRWVLLLLVAWFSWDAFFGDNDFDVVDDIRGFFPFGEEANEEEDEVDTGRGAELLFLDVEGANVRYEPHLNSGVVTTVMEGEDLFYTDDVAYDHDGRLWLSVKTSNGEYGWVSEYVIDNIPGDAMNANEDAVHQEDDMVSPFENPDESPNDEVIEFSDGTVYEGEVEQGTPHGYGSFTWANGDTYEGDVYDGLRHGYGVYEFSDGSFYEGEFVDGDFHGHGIFYYPEGSYVQGQFYENDYVGP